MPINTGWLLSEITDAASRTVRVRILYDATQTPIGSGQSLIDGPGGYCLEVANDSGLTASVVVSGPGKVDYVVLVLPILPGLLPTRRTAADLALAGFTTRGSISGIRVVI